jgi:hypothetical protein
VDSAGEPATFPRVGERDKYFVSRDGRAMARDAALSSAMYVAGNPQGFSLELPNLAVNLVSALAPTRDGFVIGNNDGIVGVVSGATPKRARSQAALWGSGQLPFRPTASSLLWETATGQ